MTDHEKWQKAQAYLYKRLRRAKLALSWAEAKGATGDEINNIKTKIAVLDYLLGLLYTKGVVT